jgi:hypothetical protein
MLNFASTLALVEVKLQRATPEADSTDFDAIGPLDPATLIARRKARRIKNAETLLDVFTWLKSKHVKRIIKLVVRDDEDGPCDDETIEACLQMFDIRYLDWNKEDLCIRTLLNGKVSKLVELWLYASGNNSVLWGWSSVGGLRDLQQVRYEENLASAAGNIG